MEPIKDTGIFYLLRQLVDEFVPFFLRNPFFYPLYFIVLIVVSHLAVAVFYWPVGGWREIGGHIGNTIFQLPSNPIFQILFILFAIYLFWFGLRQEEAAKERGELADAKIRREFEGIIARSTRLTNLMARYLMAKEEQQSLMLNSHSLSAECQFLGQEIAKLRAKPEEPEDSTGGEPKIASLLQRLVERLAVTPAMSAEHDAERPKPPTANFHLRVGTTAASQFFVPKDHDDYITSAEIFLSSVYVWMNRNQQAAMRKQEDIENLEKYIRDESRRLVGY